MTDGQKTIEQLCVERGIDAKQLAELANVDEQRMLAIVLGRWTPSPEDRDRIAGVFGLRATRSRGGTRRPCSTFTARARRDNSAIGQPGKEAGCAVFALSRRDSGTVIHRVHLPPSVFWV